MSKYIDAEKLIAKVEHIRQDWFGDSTGLEVGESGAALGAAESILDSIDEIIDSLQQEQEQYVIGGRVFGATDVEQLYAGKVYIVSNLIQGNEFGIKWREEVKMLLIKD